MSDDVPATHPLAVLDHVAVGARTLGDGWELFGGLLGGAWAYGGDSPGFWWGQLRFSAGPKIELLTPTGGANAAFLERFLADRGPGFHHLNFIVPAIEVTLGKIRAIGIEPTRVRLQDPRWKEAFLHPSDAYGTVIQVAEQDRPPASSSPPAGLGKPGSSCALSLIEQRVADLDAAVRLFADVLDGEVVSRRKTAEGSVAELSWPNEARLRLVQSAANGLAPNGLAANGLAANGLAANGLAANGRASGRSGQGIVRLRFTCDGGAFGPADLENAAALSARLGVSVQLEEVDQ